jgi:hypothetical protein
MLSFSQPYSFYKKIAFIATSLSRKVVGLPIKTDKIKDKNNPLQTYYNKKGKIL